MNLHSELSPDVLVAGGGIGGIMAAIRAAESGCTVALAASGGLFSGSSFYPGTWGLGLTAPLDDEDGKDLVRVIKEAGCGMAVPEMVDTLVNGIRPAIADILSMGIKLRRAENRDQKEFIPCFDEKVRDWYGIEFDSARQVFGKRLHELNVEILDKCDILKLVQDDGRVCGAVAAYKGDLRYIGCRALVLATGGYGSIFRYHLCTSDVAGVGQALALEAGCSLVNMEFMQMMPGYISPAFQTIFNEKTFRFTKLWKQNGEPLLPEDAHTRKLLELRSTHGPFTSRLASKEVDLALFREFLCNASGVKVTYSKEMQKNPPEFITTYFDWLREAKGLTMSDPVHIGIFSHAANGGILIDTHAYTGVPGLFACGEVTGGMHGADRLGGLSTANGLVFGGIAGRSAAAYAQEAENPPTWVSFEGTEVDNAAEKTRILQDTMFRNAMILRSETGLVEALDVVGRLLYEIKSGVPSEDMAAVTSSRRLYLRLLAASCVLEAALDRKESRGSHYREDYPEELQGENHRIVISLGGEKIKLTHSPADR